MRRLNIRYCFQMDDGQEELFSVWMDPERLEICPESLGELPEWTRLEFNQCENCTLPLEDDARCPAAANMVGVVNRLADLLSHDRARVVVSADDRTVACSTTMQRGICSLLGLLMAASGCPMTVFFKPMARFHLPFASTGETIWRATSTYLLGQYFKLQQGKTPDVALTGLAEIYKNIQVVNLDFAKRLRATCNHDSMVDAIILLDMFAKSMPLAIDESLKDIRHLFVPYLSETDA